MISRVCLRRASKSLFPVASKLKILPNNKVFNIIEASSKNMQTSDKKKTAKKRSRMCRKLDADLFYAVASLRQRWQSWSSALVLRRRDYADYDEWKLK
jgi:hypothetical protein